MPVEGFDRGVLEAGLLQPDHTADIERELFDYRVREAVGEAAAAAGVHMIMGLLEGRGIEMRLDARGLSLSYHATAGDEEAPPQEHAVTHCWVEMNTFFGISTSPKSITFFDGDKQFLHRD